MKGHCDSNQVNQYFHHDLKTELVSTFCMMKQRKAQNYI